MRTEDCSIAWSQKLLRYSAWSKACLNTNSVGNPCGSHVDDVQECDFHHNSYANCPTEFQSATNNYDWSDDPVLKSERVMTQEYLFAAQQSGIIYKFNLNDLVGDETLKNHIEWATSISQGEGIGGLALKKDSLFFSFYNQDQRPWVHNDRSNVTSLCGGWGALHTETGLPRWYRTHPMCNQTFYGEGAVCEFGEVIPIYTGSRSAPSVTNNLVFVTGMDSNGVEESADRKGGHAYALRVKDGSVASSFEFKRPFGKQGFSIHGRCVYTGNGLSSEDGSTASDKTNLKFAGWCARAAHDDQRFCPDLL
jgi:hypothetical protein